MIAPVTLHVLAHAARMQMVLAANPEHPRTSEYEETLRQYRAPWAALSVDDRVEHIEALTDNPATPDLTEDILSAGVAALEA